MVVITGPVYAPMYVQGEWVAINRTIGTYICVLTYVQCHCSTDVKTLKIPVHENSICSQ